MVDGTVKQSLSGRPMIDRRVKQSLFNRPMVAGWLEIYFPVSPQSRAGWKFIFRSPRSRGLAGNLFSGIPVLAGWLEIYFPLSPQSRSGWKFIFRSPRTRRAGWKFIFRSPRSRGLAGNLFSGQTADEEFSTHFVFIPK
jgi:hypothetical protein